MKINYADRRNDKNIIAKRFVISNSTDCFFKGKIGLIILDEIQRQFIAKRPSGKSETVIDNGFKILTYFPESGAYCCTVMINKENQILQWYFDILKDDPKFDGDIPYGEDMFLDVILTPMGEYYMIDEDDLGEALKNKVITHDDFVKAYESANLVKELAKNRFDKLYKFTKNSIEKLQSLL